MFENILIKQSGLLVLFKRTLLLVAAVYCVIALIAGYRAWYQVKSLELRSTDIILHQGSAIETRMVSYARTTVEVRVELIQGSHSETLAVQSVRGNWWAFGDPRTRQGSQTVVLTADVLNRFERGKAQVRATATGRPQWTRLPPPVVRELAVEIKPN